MKVREKECMLEESAKERKREQEKPCNLCLKVKDTRKYRPCELL